MPMARRSLLLLFLPLSGLVAQQSRPLGNELAVHAEAVGAGVRYTAAVGSRVAIGPSITAGRSETVTISRSSEFGNLRTWATAYLTILVAPTPRLRVVLQPIGVAVTGGDDFAAAYPSAQGGLEWRSNRLLVGTDVRVLRIAGGNGTGHYWAAWIPLRVGITWP